MLQLRPLERHEIKLIWSIDRSEVHHHVYRLCDGELALTPAYFDVPGWPPEQVVNDTPVLQTCFDWGSAFMGMFNDDQLVGVVVVDTIPLGPSGDQLQLKYLFVSRAHRKWGVGGTLFREAQRIARARGAKALCISATPTENTVNFYRRCGAVLTTAPDSYLYALEPDGIHLVCPV